MPALNVLGHRIALLADDDLRGMAQRSFLMRCVQLALLIPSGITLSNVHRSAEDCTMLDETQENDNINNSDEDADDSVAVLTIAWTFWAFSLATFVVSLVLELFIFAIASQGSPVQTERRRALPGLCAAKLLPLALLRLAAVALAVATIAGVRDLCTTNSSSGGGTTPRIGDEAALPSSSSCEDDGYICSAATRPTLLLLAVMHLVEVGFSAMVVGLLLLRGACSQGRKRHKQFQQWLSLYSVCNFLSRRKDRDIGNDINAAVVSASESSSGWWEHCCRVCCLMASCCTCCLFGGSEVLKKSCGCGGGDGGGGGGDPSQQKHSPSWLSDLSLVLSDFFDSGVGDDSEGFLDVTPSDILVGLRVLETEQSLQMRQRFQQLEKAGHDDAHDVETGQDPGSPTVISSLSLAKGFVDLDDDNELEKNNDEKEKEHSDVDSHSKASSNSGSTRWKSERVQAIRLIRDDSEANANFSTYERKRLVKENIEDRQAIIEGAHYMRLAQAVYGHMMYLKTYQCSAPCSLLAGVLTCRTCRCREDRPTVIGDNLCRLNELSLVQVANVKVEDVIFCSFKTGVGRCPYAIVVDKPKKTIVLTVRGTISLEAAATDLSIRPELLDDFRDRYEGLNNPSVEGEYCHSGMLSCALTVYDDLQQLGILDELLLTEKPRFPDFDLVCTGHSLGAGVAAILGILLRTKFPTLRCLCFAPPGCVLSERAAAQDFITSYVLGVDVVPRLSLHSVEGLRDDVLLMIARIKVPKHIAFQDSRELGLAAKDRVQPVSVDSLKELAYERGGTPESSFYHQVCKFKERQRKLKLERTLEDVQLCPPGRIVHLVENCLNGASGYFDFLRQRETRYTPVWADKVDFSEIQISPTLLDDHNPDSYLLHLGILAETFAEQEKSR